MNTPDGPAAWRRGVYVYQRRSLPYPMFDTFDHPDMNVTAGARNVSTVPTQALTLLNNPFVLSQAQLFADRVSSEADDDPASQVDLAYRIALARPPTADRDRRSAPSLIAQPVARRIHARRCSTSTSSCTSGERHVASLQQDISGIGANFCSAPAAASAAWRWRICSIGRACWRPTPAPRRRRVRRRRRRRAIPYAPKPPHFKPRATAVISLFMGGGWSQVDTFDPKPALAKYAGRADRRQGAGRRHRAAGISRPADAEPVHVQEVRAERHRGVGAVPAHRPARRRDRVPALGLRAVERSRAGHLRDADRADQPGISRASARGSPTAWDRRRRACPRTS